MAPSCLFWNISSEFWYQAPLCGHIISMTRQYFMKNSIFVGTKFLLLFHLLFNLQMHAGGRSPQEFYLETENGHRNKTFHRIRKWKKYFKLFLNQWVVCASFPAAKRSHFCFALLFFSFEKLNIFSVLVEFFILHLLNNFLRASTHSCKYLCLAQYNTHSRGDRSVISDSI